MWTVDISARADGLTSKSVSGTGKGAVRFRIQSGDPVDENTCRVD